MAHGVPMFPAATGPSRKGTGVTGNCAPLGRSEYIEYYKRTQSSGVGSYTVWRAGGCAEVLSGMPASRFSTQARFRGPGSSKALKLQRHDLCILLGELVPYLGWKIFAEVVKLPQRKHRPMVRKEIHHHNKNNKQIRYKSAIDQPNYNSRYLISRITYCIAWSHLSHQEFCSNLNPKAEELKIIRRVFRSPEFSFFALSSFKSILSDSSTSASALRRVCKKKMSGFLFWRRRCRVSQLFQGFVFFIKKTMKNLLLDLLYLPARREELPGLLQQKIVVYCRFSCAIECQQGGIRFVQKSSLASVQNKRSISLSHIVFGQLKNLTINFDGKSKLLFTRITIVRPLAVQTRSAPLSCC